MPGAAGVATPVIGSTDPLVDERLNQFEPVTKSADQLTVEVVAPMLRISTLSVTIEPPFWRAWNKTPVLFTDSSGPSAATNNDMGVSTSPAGDETWMMS